jgi:hypothetical protein
MATHLSIYICLPAEFIVGLLSKIAFLTMTKHFFAPPTHFQLQSPLVGLPAEIKHQIFGLCLTADHVISDPTIHSRTQSTATRSLGVALLQTCRRLYHEIDRRPLFSQNTFRFTTVDQARAFLKALDDHYRESVQDIEIDIRKFDSDRSDVAREWLQYLAEKHDPRDTISASLRMDVPRLRTLRLNFESWPRIAIFRHELWHLLRQMLSSVHGLERIMLIGASKGAGMMRRDPWSPAHFIGRDDVECNDLIPRMWKCVEAPFDAKVIRWTRPHATLCLEVVSQAHLLKHVDGSWCRRSVRGPQDKHWPVNGSCSWSEFDTHGSMIVDPVLKAFNPTVGG